MPLADSLGAFDALVEGREDPRDRPLAIHRRSGCAKRWTTRRERADPRRARCRPGTIMVEREKLEGAAARRGASERPRRSSPSTASPTASSPASIGPKQDLAKASRGGDRVEPIWTGKGCACSSARPDSRGDRRRRSPRSRSPGPMAQPGIAAALASATSVEQLRELTAHDARAPPTDRRLSASSPRPCRIGSARPLASDVGAERSTGIGGERMRHQVAVRVAVPQRAAARRGTSSITSSCDSKCGLGMISRQRFGPIRST